MGMFSLSSRILSAKAPLAPKVQPHPDNISQVAHNQPDLVFLNKTVGTFINHVEARCKSKGEAAQNQPLRELFRPGLLVGRSLACMEVVDARLIVELCKMLRHWRCCGEDWVESCLCS